MCGARGAAGDAQPGEKYIYGYNTDILGVVVERASGMSLDAFAKAEIDRILRETISDPVGPEFMAPPERIAA